MTIKEINKIAEYEGWGIFACYGSSEVQDGTMMIQKTDDEDMCFFRDDSEAFNHVHKLGDMGSHLHQYALTIVENSLLIN